MKKLFFTTLFAIIALINPLTITIAIAQPPLGDPEPIPMDNGLIFLLIAGFILGVVTLYKQRKKIKA